MSKAIGAGTACNGPSETTWGWMNIARRCMAAHRKYYYLDSMQFNLKDQKTDEPLTLNSGALSDETLDKVLEDINQHVRKTEKKELL